MGDQMSARRVGFYAVRRATDAIFQESGSESMSTKEPTIHLGFVANLAVELFHYFIARPAISIGAG
jgi:hypothetical protein